MLPCPIDEEALSQVRFDSGFTAPKRVIASLFCWCYFTENDPPGQALVALLLLSTEGGVSFPFFGEMRFGKDKEGGMGGKTAVFCDPRVVRPTRKYIESKRVNHPCVRGREWVGLLCISE
jgi:hypothetical protein